MKSRRVTRMSFDFTAQAEQKSSENEDIHLMALDHELELANIKRLLLGVGLFKDKGCWIWFGARDAAGYGRLNVDGFARQAHRLSYRVFRGPIPRGLFVCHACDTPPCINPDHLFLGTAADNSLDRVLKDRARRLGEMEAAQFHECMTPDISPVFPVPHGGTR